jgi:hypothetical protein
LPINRENTVVTVNTHVVGNLGGFHNQLIQIAAVAAVALADLKSCVSFLRDQSSEAWVFPPEKLTTPVAKDDVEATYRLQTRKGLVQLGRFHVLRRTG